MAGHLIDLAILLVEAEPPAFCLRVIILNLQADDRAHTRKGERHDGDQRAIAQTDEGGRIHAVQQLARLD